MVDPAPAPAGTASVATDPETRDLPAPTTVEAADPPEGERQERHRLWRRLRRNRLGIAALLPALLLAAAFVAAPFSGTSTHSVDQPGPTVTAPYAPGTGSGR